MLKRYRLNHGTHRQAGRKFNSGDEIDSVHELDKMFEKGRFTLLPPKYQPDQAEADAPVAEHAAAVVGKKKMVRGGTKKAAPAPPPPAPESEGLEVRHRRAGWYDVVNPITGEKINDKALKIDQANALVADHDG